LTSSDLPHFGDKPFDQRDHRIELNGLLGIVNVAVIALTALIVVSENPPPARSINRALFIAMFRWWHWLRYLPDLLIDEASIAEIVSSPQ
jgi:hypothetical protein